MKNNWKPNKKGFWIRRSFGDKRYAKAVLSRVAPFNFQGFLRGKTLKMIANHALNAHQAFDSSSFHTQSAGGLLYRVLILSKFY